MNSSPALVATCKLWVRKARRLSEITGSPGRLTPAFTIRKLKQFNLQPGLAELPLNCKSIKRLRPSHQCEVLFPLKCFSSQNAIKISIKRILFVLPARTHGHLLSINLHPVGRALILLLCNKGVIKSALNPSLHLCVLV